ncbi:MAG: hypothetical protein B7Y39_10660 [Bdellovibrio sp. 28-41-41]|nr:MAG: hypothetical protein B7Y39_10660 [Bdellovibrio sp. 28-41-41]
MNFTILNGDSREVLKSLSTNSVDSLLTDPPAGIGLRGLSWDSSKGGRKQWVSSMTEIFTECFRVLKPGAHGFIWAIPRTSHWTATALEDSGFHVRDVVTHIFGSGFPKSIALDKSIQRSKYLDTESLYKATEWIRTRRDQLKLTNRKLDEVAGVTGGACHWTALPPNGNPHVPTHERWTRLRPLLGPAPDWLEEMIKPSWVEPENWNLGKFKTQNSSLSEKWKGWGTSLKPASEHWILVQKPISEHNISANVLKYGVGGINIDEARTPVNGKIPSTSNLNFKNGGLIWETSERSKTSVYHQHPKGRFPSNLIITKSNEGICPAKLIDDQGEREVEVSKYFKLFSPDIPFFYSKKANQTEKEIFNTHPTVKPIRLMCYLAKIITPPNGTILDPFMGSGTTGMAAIKDNFKFIGIEKDESYFQIAKQRLEGGTK